jgi:hypothetical protein
MDIESVFLRAMFQATDNWILRGGPEPNDKAILALAPELAGLIAAANEPEDDEEDGNVTVTVDGTLTDEERKAIEYCANSVLPTGFHGDQETADTLRALLERTK